MVSFEPVADEYDAARPNYPSAVYEALGDLKGCRALDVGAGTGIASRQLAGRGCRVVAVDVGHALLSKARGHDPALPSAVADGTALPVRDRWFDLICFAQAWHWLDPVGRCSEAHRVLAPGGRWAGWWSHPRADGEDWFDAYWSAIEAICSGTHRSQRDIDWGAGVGASGLFEVGGRITIGWTRELTVEEWMTDQASHSYIAGLSPATRRRLLGQLRTIVGRRFAGGTMHIPYQTWLWVARAS